MTNREYKLLSYIRSKNTVKWIDVLNAFDPASEGRTNDAVLEIALDSGLIETPWPSEKPPRCSIRLTVKGILALLSTEEQLQKTAEDAKKIACEEAKQEKQQRFENKIAIANLLIPLVTFVLGVLAEHYVGILNWILSLF